MSRELISQILVELRNDPAFRTLVIGLIREALDSAPSPLQEELAARVVERRSNVYCARVRRIWPYCMETAAGYGKRWQALSPHREKLAAARLREYPKAPPEILVWAMHGAMASWGWPKPANGFDALHYLRPETIFQRAKFASYLEAYREARERYDPSHMISIPPPALEEVRKASTKLFGEDS